MLFATIVVFVPNTVVLMPFIMVLVHIKFLKFHAMVVSFVHECVL